MFGSPGEGEAAVGASHSFGKHYVLPPYYVLLQLATLWFLAEVCPARWHDCRRRRH